MEVASQVASHLVFDHAFSHGLRAASLYICTFEVIETDRLPFLYARSEASTCYAEERMSPGRNNRESGLPNEYPPYLWPSFGN